MEHTQAIETLAAERYLLNEMPPEERDAFEEHYFDCSACTEAVTNGTVLMASGRAIVREERQPAANVTRLRWMARLSTAAAVAMAALLGFQTVGPRPAPVGAIAAVQAPVRLQVVEPQAIRLTRGDQAAARITARAGESIHVYVEETGPSFPRYAVQVKQKDVAVAQPIELTKDKVMGVQIEISGLAAGEYELVIEGVPGFGRHEVVKRHSIVVQGK
ncbi:MAG TPA: zf-HC2 domain-containing protein [Thermoanaerobaculia bacterium]|jgi:anti-sigma factor RsiW